MKYRIYDKINKEFLPIDRYCVNQYGDVMTINGNVLMNQADFNIITENKNVVIKTDNGFLAQPRTGNWEFIKEYAYAYCFDNFYELDNAIKELDIKNYEIIIE